MQINAEVLRTFLGTTTNASDRCQRAQHCCYFVH